MVIKTNQRLNYLTKKVMITWTNCYVNYLGEICFSKGYNTKEAAIKGRKKCDVHYLGRPIRVRLK